MAIIDTVPRKPLIEKVTFDLKEEWAEGKLEASVQLVMGASYYLALKGSEILYLVCWWHLGFGPHQFSHLCLLPYHAVLMTRTTLCSIPVSKERMDGWQDTGNGGAWCPAQDSKPCRRLGCPPAVSLCSICSKSLCPPCSPRRDHPLGHLCFADRKTKAQRG